MPKCPRCNKSVYAAEQTLHDGQAWHNICLIAYTKDQSPLVNAGGFWSTAAKSDNTKPASNATSSATRPSSTSTSTSSSSAASSASSAGRARFCSSCGRAFAESDSFCAGCGNKRT